MIFKVTDMIKEIKESRTEDYSELIAGGIANSILEIKRTLMRNPNLRRLFRNKELSKRVIENHIKVALHLKAVQKAIDDSDG